MKDLSSYIVCIIDIIYVIPYSCIILQLLIKCYRTKLIILRINVDTKPTTALTIYFLSRNSSSEYKSQAIICFVLVIVRNIYVNILIVDISILSNNKVGLNHRRILINSKYSMQISLKESLSKITIQNPIQQSISFFLRENFSSVRKPSLKVLIRLQYTFSTRDVFIVNKRKEIVILILSKSLKVFFKMFNVQRIN